MHYVDKVKSWMPTRLAAQLFLAITLLESIVDICIVAILLNSFEDKIVRTVLDRTEDSVLPVYLGLFVLAHLVQLILAWDAIIAKNTIQILALCIFNTLFLAYAVVQILEIKSLVNTGTLRAIVWLIPGMISLTEFVYLATFPWIYREFGWQVFKQLGADRGIKKAFMWYQVFLCSLKFDFFFFIAFSLQLLLLVLQQNALERALTIAALPVTFLILFIGYLAVRRENKTFFCVFLIGCVVGACYFIYKLILIYRNRATDYILVFKSLTVFAGICFLALVWTITCAVICYQRFDRGLRYHLMKGSTNSPRLPIKDDEEDNFAMGGKAGNRMSID